MPAHKPTTARDIPRTIDLRPSANLFQLSTVLVVSVVGAVVGYQVVAGGHWIAAACGGVVGMIVATFLSGFILMFFPQQIPAIGIDASINKYRRLRRRMNIAGWSYVISAAVAVGWMVLSLPISGWLIAAWSIPMFVSYVLLQYTGHVLDLWRCPSCDEPFGRRGAFASYLRGRKLANRLKRSVIRNI